MKLTKSVPISHIEYITQFWWHQHPTQSCKDDPFVCFSALYLSLLASKCDRRWPLQQFRRNLPTESLVWLFFLSSIGWGHYRVCCHPLTSFWHCVTVVMTIIGIVCYDVTVAMTITQNFWNVVYIVCLLSLNTFVDCIYSTPFGLKKFIYRVHLFVHFCQYTLLCNLTL